MKKSVALLMVSLVLLGTTTQSCKQEPNLQESAPITNDEGTSVMIESSIQKKEWEQFKINIDSTIYKNELRIAELKMEMQKTKKTTDSTAILKIEVLEAKNEAIKTKLSSYVSQESKNWNNFKLELDRDLTNFETALNQYAATDKKTTPLKRLK